MPQCHMRIYSCLIYKLNATSQNGDTFVCDVMKAQ